MAMGKKEAKEKLTSRWTKFDWRVRKLNSVKKNGRRMQRGVAMVYKQGLKPSVVYGV